jgi:hypothetical protein
MVVILEALDRINVFARLRAGSAQAATRGTVRIGCRVLRPTGADTMERGLGMKVRDYVSERLAEIAIGDDVSQRSS